MCTSPEPLSRERVVTRANNGRAFQVGGVTRMTEMREHRECAGQPCLGWLNHRGGSQNRGRMAIDGTGEVGRA